jgi:hypothetical protein
MKLSIWILFIALATLALTGVAHAEEPTVAASAVHAELPQSPLFTAQSAALGTPSSEAGSSGTESYNCSATTTCPGNPRYGIAPYELTCYGDYECYVYAPGVAVVCDGFGTLCFP